VGYGHAKQEGKVMWFSRIVLGLSLSLPALGWAFNEPVPLPLPDQSVIAINAQGVDIAAGKISQDVLIENPTGALYNRQVLRIELSSPRRQKVSWGDQFQPKHGLKLPTHTTGKNVLDLWMFEYLGSPERVWSFIGTTQPVFVPAPDAPAQ
jgi:hypothetical protein